MQKLFGKLLVDFQSIRHQIFSPLQGTAETLKGGIEIFPRSDKPSMLQGAPQLESGDKAASRAVTADKSRDLVRPMSLSMCSSLQASPCILGVSRGDI